VLTLIYVSMTLVISGALKLIGRQLFRQPA
jgi:hypothetical protein